MSTPHIIISYRRADSDAIAGRIRDQLASHFGESSLFMDIDNIPFGTDFRQYIQEELSRDHILIAVIGPKWLGPVEPGHFRIAEETDPVRIELETALKKGSPVIPVLVEGATMPSPSELPDSLKDLSYRNAAEVDTGRDFHLHIERLIRFLDHLIAETSRGGAAAANAAEVPAVAAAAPAHIPAAALLQAPDTASAAVAKGGAVAATAPLEIPPAKGRPYRALGIALSAFLVAGLGTGAWLYVRSKNQVARSPVAVTPSTAERHSTARPVGVASAGCKLDIPVTWADDFQTLDPAWRLPAQIAYQVDGQLALNALEGKNARVLYPPLRFKNVVICASVKSPLQPGSLDGQASGGVIFWATNISNFYLAAIYLNGTYAVYRMTNNNWISVIRRTPFESIKSGAGAVNEIQVTAEDNAGTLYINSVKVGQFRGQPPKGGSMIGLYGDSNANERDEWRMLNVAVGDPDQTQSQATARAPVPAVGPGCKPLRRAAFDDRFKTADPGWDVVSGNTKVRFGDGEMVIKPDVSTAWRQLYRSLLFKDATVCIRVKSPSRTTDGTASGGLVFWAADLKNYYAAAIYPEGRFAIDRSLDGEWARLVSAKIDGVKTGLDATNELVVTFDGNMAAFYVNNQNVFEFRGQPPRNGGSIGLFAQSDKAAEDEWRFTDIVVVEHE